MLACGTLTKRAHRQNVTDKGETGKTLSKSNVRNMKSKSAGQRKEEPVLHGEGTFALVLFRFD